ncbi:MAG: CopG family transcriptional regulator [Thermomicrobiales bacterium]|nr:CopG family transcriptional regulator [Thermomicrobiales bacterium]
MKKTTIYVPDELAIQVTSAAKQRGKSEASVIREAIASYVTTVERPMPKSIGIVAVEGVSGEDTEEWLLANWHPE